MEDMRGVAISHSSIWSLPSSVACGATFPQGKAFLRPPAFGGGEVRIAFSSSYLVAENAELSNQGKEIKGLPLGEGGRRQPDG